MTKPTTSELLSLINNQRKLSLCHVEMESCEEFLRDLIRMFFPGPDVEDSAVAALQAKTEKSLKKALSFTDEVTATKLAHDFWNEVPQIFQIILSDAKAINEGDPASSGVDEVILTYPGFLAIATHRVAHFFYTAGVKIFPRALSELAHSWTGIDIHPGATIGKSFCIDHGTGIVIGETSNIGNNVKIYQGVTLGGLSVRKDLASKKRHPTIEDNVVIYANATILGGKTVIGHDSIVGGNVWINRSVPPFSGVIYKGELVIEDLKASDISLTWEI